MSHLEIYDRGETVREEDRQYEWDKDWPKIVKGRTYSDRGQDKKTDRLDPSFVLEGVHDVCLYHSRLYPTSSPSHLGYNHFQ